MIPPGGCAPSACRRQHLREVANALLPAASMRKPSSVPMCLFFLMLTVHQGQSVCVNVSSDTEAVLGMSMKLTCIFCLMREEMSAETRVDWYYSQSVKDRMLIYLFDREPHETDGPFKGRLQWNGSKDLQDVSISIVNVTMNDTGQYECVVFRKFFFDTYTHSVILNKTINLVVRKEASEDTTALYSEIMMYVLLVFLTFWLLVEMIYCYRKISKSDEQSQDNATDYLAIPSENKENPGPPVME
ncbi:sodium channel regulatory subunit beta-3 isoform X2 [Denticeps clupeoides]|uniref:Sodium channel regulatory subunit beta-3 n=1 Tax=Denticeps clupeoides TaxID=299321 RepID=A0AAY4AJ21_9TELE|nr:sodium channel subunit beta-3 isoform X2 [Denticeps clupeoides]